MAVRYKVEWSCTGKHRRKAVPMPEENGCGDLYRRRQT